MHPAKMRPSQAILLVKGRILHSSELTRFSNTDDFFLTNLMPPRIVERFPQGEWNRLTLV